MNDLNELLRPLSGVEKWMYDTWNQITPEEKKVISGRMEEIFAEGLPFQLHHDKSYYINVFAVLLHLEVLGTQMFLKYIYKEHVHAQFLDELFHCLVFLKIIYLLDGANSLALEHNETLNALCDPIRNEECPKTGLLLLNLILEGWIEEVFNSFERKNIAPKVFNTINNDERNHVMRQVDANELSRAELENIKKKLQHLEVVLLVNFFSQYQYTQAINLILGLDESIHFLKQLDTKHKEQLKQINLKPSKQWNYFMRMLLTALPKIHENSQAYYQVEMTPLRQALMSQWDNPRDPTMVGQFNLNVSSLDMFNRKYPSETLTTLMLQTISFGVSQNALFSSFLRQNQLHQNKKQFVALAVKLPDCADHIGAIVFENCHNINVIELAQRVRNVLQMMVFCYKKREELEKAHPHLKLVNKEMFNEVAEGAFGIPMFGGPFISLSNIGSCGYSQGKSPLFSNEAIKFTIMEVERRQVWNNEKKCFEAQDLLPVSMSADHRIFDGNIPIPKMMIHYFDRMYQKMVQDIQRSISKKDKSNAPFFLKSVDYLLDNHLEIGYRILNILQTIWPEYLSLEQLFSLKSAKEFLKRNSVATS